VAMIMWSSSYHISRGSALIVPARHCSTTLYATTSGLDPSNFDLDGLRYEAKRKYERAIKKVSKKSSRLAETGVGSEELLIAKNERDAFATLCSLIDTDIQAAVAEANRLGVGDAPPPRPTRGFSKKQGKKPPQSTGPRLPYWSFDSESGIAIRVGRSASDNDLLSCDPSHREPNDFWLHVAGAPGSHVVVCAPQLENLVTSDRETALDAAVLATWYSKAIPKQNDPNLAKGSASVSLVRARQVSKPPGAKPGLVQIRGGGDITTLTIDLSRERSRLSRILETRRFTDDR